MSKTIYLSEKNMKYLQQTYPGTSFGDAFNIFLSHNELLKQENIKLKQEIEQLKNNQPKDNGLTQIISILNNHTEILNRLSSNPKQKETSKPPIQPKIEKTPIQKFFEYMQEEKNELIAEYKKMEMYHPENIKGSLEGILQDRLKKFNLKLDDIQNLPEYKEVIGCEPEFKKLQEEYDKKYGYNDSI